MTKKWKKHTKKTHFAIKKRIFFTPLFFGWSFFALHFKDEFVELEKALL
jgi:hypothetical protein